MATKHWLEERNAFLEKQIKEVAREKHLAEILLEHCIPQVIILEAQPQPAPVPSGLEHIKPWRPPKPDSFFSEHNRKLIQEHPGMLFHSNIARWYVGLTHDAARLVFVPDTVYGSYEQECLKSAGWSEQSEQEWEDDITVEYEETGELETPDWPNPQRRAGVWKARQVAHYTGETDVPELNYSVWANGTWG